MFAPGHIRRRNRRRLAGGAGTYAADFDQASAAAIDPAGARLTPVKHWNTQWAWWAVRHPDLFTQPAFAIAKASHYNAVSGMWLACWAAAADTDTWNQLTATIGASDITFSPAAAFPGGPIYLAALPMYPFSRVQRKVTAWTAQANVSSPASATNYVIGTATARDAGDGSGRTAPALPWYALKVTNVSGYTKNKAIITAYNHPSETPGAYQLEGFMDWLFAASPQAKMLLDYFELYIYPCLNPQGVWSGYFRSNPAEPTQDHNRVWNATAGHEDAAALKAAFDADTGGAIAAGIDFHAWMDAGYHYGYAYNHTDTNVAAFDAEMLALDANYTTTADTTASMLANVLRGTYGASPGITLEAAGAGSKGLADWKLYGQYAGRCLAALLAKGYFAQGPGVGSRSFNGTTARIDFANAANPAGAALTLSAWLNLSSSPSNGYILCVHDSGDTSYGFVINDLSGLLDVIRHGTTDYLWADHASALTSGTWHHIVVTSTGGLLAASVAMYVDGAARTVDFTNGSGAETAHTGKWSLGGRIYSDTRNLPGKLAQVGVWNRVLTTGEIANLAAGYAPDLAAASGLQFYFKGNTSSLTAAPGGLGSADGTSSSTGVGNGPSIIYP